MNTEVFEKARQARDPRFDGRFFIGVKTTGIYCRPVCRVRMPLPENVVFYPTAAAAQEAGFRLRCRPESAPGTPAWRGTGTTVSRGLRLIGEGALDTGSVGALAERLGVTTRHLSRLFTEHLGASPVEVAQTRRLHTAKKLLDETTLGITEIALLAGYGSVRRFNEHFQQVYQKSPSEIRGASQPVSKGLSLTFPYRPPYDFEGIIRFLGIRAIPGVEAVEGNVYQRAVVSGNSYGSVRVSHDEGNHRLVASIDLDDASQLMQVVGTIRKVFDLNADPLEVNDCLTTDPVMAGLVAENPGQRVPGAWDPFEISVRAIVGQQISVKGATTVMGRIARTSGDLINGQQYFPAPAQLAAADPESLPMPKARARAIIDFSRAVAAGDIDFDSATSSEVLMDKLVQIKGIGGWTARYIAMRALNDPDAFLHDDLVIMKVAKRLLPVENSTEMAQLAERWRPWRAYAGMHLWRQAQVLP
ncbi:MAG: helix-turn-helix domain-containing protein [Pseudomonadales bacterium]|nr:helix-turn-helix domain-containing protein [Pseudomonadales bacterium]